MENVENTDIVEEQEQQGEPVPVCIGCFRHVGPLYYYCPNCGEAFGPFTMYLLYIRIRWMATIWGRAWRQIFDPDISIPGRLLRLVMIIWNVPIILVGLFFLKDLKKEQPPQKPDN